VFENLSSLLFTLLSFFVGLSVVVFVHEFGHFWVARRNGVRCDAFSIGFGPELFGWTDKLGTRWKFSVIPLGGYVKMFGEAETMQAVEGGATDAEKKDRKIQRVPRELTPEEQKVSFKHKRISQRAAIVFAGPGVNFLFAILVYWMLFMMMGRGVTEPVIGQVMPNSAAAESGLQSEDRIITIDGATIDRFEDIKQKVALGNGQPLTLGIKRAGEDLSILLTPRLMDTQPGAEKAPPKEFLIGIVPSGERKYISLNPVQALGASVGHSYMILESTVIAVGQMITGKRGTEGLGGPIGVAKFMGQAAKSGLGSFIEGLAFFSLSLGFINLFPIPLLDGGHLLFYAIEAVRGRPLSEQAQEWGLRVGLALVLALMVFATVNDIVHF